ncbi:MAG: ATP-binding protein [Candidatus Gracilibacteria bacterium]|nr:ATP-binding protein [Candidatus Gracilibacteria bacterium]
MIIKRNIFDKIIEVLDSKKIIILRGPRQVGKTTLMKDIQSFLGDKKTVFFNMDDLDIKSKISTPKDLLKYIKFEFGYNENEEITIFLDEFQNIENAGIFLKNIYDSYSNISIICSGSSSLEITKNSEFLTGRKIIFDITGFTFLEYLKANNFKNNDLKFSLDNFDEIISFYGFYKKELEKYLEEYLTIGGYPEIVLTSGNLRQQIAKDIIETYIKKDITSFLRVENITAFNNLIKIFSSQIGNLVNKSEINTTLGISINTLGKYIEILEGTFILNLVNPYFSNIRKELSKMPKIYFNDLGLRNYVLYGNLNILQSQDIGELVENFIYNELKEKSNIGINFYRTISKSEIDFIFQKSYDELIPIEVKYRNKVSIPESIKIFNDNYNDKVKENIIFTKDILDKKDNIYLIPSCLIGFINL